MRTPNRAFLEDESRPQAGAGEVLVKVAAAGVCMSDLEVLRGTRPAAYVRYPIIPGHEWCGTVEDVAPGVRSVTAGQRVAVEGHAFCRRCPFCRRGETNLCVTYNEHGFTLPGGFAEYAAVRADLVHPFADGVPFEAAALTEPLACVVHGTERAQVTAGDTVVVVGPGTVGLLAVACAGLRQPAWVAAIGLDRSNEAVARAIGATHYWTVDEKPVDRVRELTEGRGADVVFEAGGNEAAVPPALELARRGGTVVLMGIVGGGRRLFLESDLFCLQDLRVHGVFAYRSQNFEQALRLIESGRVNVAPLVTHRFPLSDFEKAFDLLARRTEPAVKVVLRP